MAKYRHLHDFATKNLSIGNLDLYKVNVISIFSVAPDVRQNDYYCCYSPGNRAGNKMSTLYAETCEDRACFVLMNSFHIRVPYEDEDRKLI
ncbi:unnamed protein product [Leptosia nina]|uniref:Uncharacterized protein n=1 Tax=Leptosia nina TaxID=320188 RepID=A0AAV1K5V2_9NEOP